MANHRAEAGADDRIPPSQECSPHPGRKTTQKQTRQPQKNQPKMVKRMANQTCTESQKVSRTQRQPGIDQAKQKRTIKTPSNQGKSRDPNLRSETSETTAIVDRKQAACYQTSQNAALTRYHLSVLHEPPCQHTNAHHRSSPLLSRIHHPAVLNPQKK